MKFALLLALAWPCAAATFYVSSTGNDSTGNGSSGNPWLTPQYAVNNMACGDTLNIVADGTRVANADTVLPVFPHCVLVTTIQSSNQSLLPGNGTRINPAVDGPNMGKIEFATSGITTSAETHGGTTGGYILDGNLGEGCGISSITSDIITIGGCGAGLPGFGNGWLVTVDVAPNLNSAFYTIISGLTLGQKYYVINCSVSPACTGTGGSFQVSLTLGGSPITGLTCTGTCSLTTQTIVDSLQVTTGSSTWTSPDSFINWANGTQVTLAATNAQTFGTLPAPFALNTTYCIGNVSGRNFTLAATCGGTPIVVTNIGSGALSASDINLASNWRITGIDMTDSNNGTTFYGMIQLGSGFESSTRVGNPNHFEIDHIWCHELSPGEATPPNKCIVDNSTYANIHDNYIAGMLSAESQAINWCGSAGPTNIFNNFLEAGGENTLAGGCASASGTANMHKIFQGNYFYKPPLWKVTSASAGTPSGSGLYDATDPNHSGGEWFLNTTSMQYYQVGSNGMWASTISIPPTAAVTPNTPAFVDIAEHKNGQYFKYSGNLMNYSWPQRQSGEAFNNAGEVNSGPGAGPNAHIYINNNAIYNVFQLVTGRQSYCTNGLAQLPCSTPAADHKMINNLTVASVLICGVPSVSGTCGANPFMNGWNGSYVVPFTGDYQMHNTIWTPDTYPGTGPAPMFTGSPTGGNPPFPGFPVNSENFLNNLESGDFNADSVSAGNALLYYYSNSTFSNNALKGATGTYTSGAFGTGNSWANAAFPAANSNIGWVNATGDITGDYHLASTSAYSASSGCVSPNLCSTDGTDLGADIDMVAMMTSGAVAGVPNWEVAAKLSVTPYSTAVIFSYTAPTSGVCTAYIYSAPARITANLVTSKADSDSTAVSNGIDRQIPITGLSASTQYWPLVDCGTVKMVGTGGGIASLWTRAAGSGTYPWQFQFASATAMRYSTSASMSSPTNLGAATTQTVPVTHAQVTLYAQVGTTGPITIVAAP